MSEQAVAHVKPQSLHAELSSISHSILQRCSNGVECEECRKKREGTLQRAAVKTAPPQSVPPIVYEVLRSPGQPLDAGTQAFMGSRFGHDFSGVRVHTDQRAAESARSVNALAYTVGRDVVFGAGQFAPGMMAGKRLLAHELAHTIQQSNTGGLMQASAGKLQVNTPGDAYEQEADTAASLVVASSTRQNMPVSLNQSPNQRIPVLQRAVECSLDHIEKECNNAAASCMSVQDECKKRYPKPSDIDEIIKKGKEKSKELASVGPNAAANMLHFLDNTGTELVMPANVFANHKATKAQLLKHREKFLAGAKRRLEAGTLGPDALSEVIVWTDTANAFSFLKQDDLGYAVGGYTLCSKVRVKARKVGPDKFEVSFVEWNVQAFDCYNWDPGKGIGVPGASDTDMCCIENAGKAKHFRIRTDVWKNTDADSMKPGEITATLPSSKTTSVPAPAPGVSPPPPPPPSTKKPESEK
jgi:hypothetical protein